jgi:two-component system OmpR family sensor kinase
MQNIFYKLNLLFHSIRLRIALWFVLILGLVLTAFSGLIYLSRTQEIQEEAINRLQFKVHGLERLFRSQPYDVFIVNDPPFISNQDDNTLLFNKTDILALFTSNSSVLHVWGPLSETAITDLSKSYSAIKYSEFFLYQINTSPSQRITYIFTTKSLVSSDGEVVFFLVGSPLDPGNQLHNLVLTLSILVTGALVIALAGGFWLADRAMRPVKTITSTVRQISETDLSQRLNLKQKDEIGQLADTFDDMLGRIQAGFERQQQFTADASHELRTPLTIVNLEAGRALEAPRTQSEYQRALKTIQSENSIMTGLVNNLLTLARLDAGREVFHQELLDLSDVVLDVADRLTPLAKQNNLELTTGDLPEVSTLGDRKALIQMLTNLTENAIKYSSQNKTGALHRVTIETGSHPDQATGWVRVTDSGPGIPQEHLTHLFDRFYRVDESRTRDENLVDDDISPVGSGLGLAIVDAIVRLHRGKIEVESELGKGSVFTVLFPLAQL